MDLTVDQIRKLGRDHLEDKHKKKNTGKLSTISNSHRPGWIKGLAFLLVSTGEVTVNVAETALEIKREIKEQRELRAGMRLLHNMERDGYITPEVPAIDTTGKEGAAAE